MKFCEIMQKIWSETVPEAKLWSETYFLTKRSETKRNEAKNFSPEFCEKEAKPSETVCVSLSFAWSEIFLEAKLGHPTTICRLPPPDCRKIEEYYLDPESLDKVIAIPVDSEPFRNVQHGFPSHTQSIKGGSSSLFQKRCGALAQHVFRALTLSR